MPINIDNNAFSAIILVVGSIITTWLTLRAKNHIQTKYRERRPKDRLEYIFDGYEKLVDELQGDIKMAREVNEEQHKTIIKMQETINKLDIDLKATRKQNKELLSKLALATQG